MAEEATPSRKRVAVIGAGVSGLVALKECLAEGQEAICFDAQSVIGGGWAYQPDTSGPVHSSIYAGVMLNSCRDTSAYSDFPLDPARYGDFFTHAKFVQYLREYAAHFGLAKHIRLNTKVVECVPVEDGKWKVKIQPDGSGPEELLFDVVITATGHLSKPVIPDFSGIKDFKGQVLHSHVYRTPTPFEGKRVAIIGVGSSGVDIADEIAPQAAELHVVTRRGAWVIPRYILGMPAEAMDNRATVVWLSEKANQWVMGKLLNVVAGEHPAELKPNHGLLEQNPTISGGFLEKVRCGIITIHRTDVDRFTETGLALADGKTLDVDVVICATGYDQFDAPFLPADAMRSAETPPLGVDLYKFIVPPRYPGLYFLGFIDVFGPLPPAVEAQARYVAAAIDGRIKLPAENQMLADIRKVQKHQEQTYIRSARHAFTAQYVPYIDELLGALGAVPSFGKMIGKVFTGNPVRGLKLLNAVWFGVTSSAQWRLYGHGAKAELAQETVLRIAGENKKLADREVEVLAAGA